MVIGRKIDRELGIEKIARVKIRVPPGKLIPINRGVPGDGCRRWVVRSKERPWSRDS